MCIRDSSHADCLVRSPLFALRIDNLAGEAGTAHMIGFDLDFEPDPFQLEAAAAIRSGESVVVTAPTGSGKTLVAEVAIRDALSRGKKAFYTTPLKALSNQKFNDFRQVFPDVGLLTGARHRERPD